MRLCATLAVVLALVSTATFAGEEAKVPKDLVKVTSTYVGNWTVEGTVGDKPFKGTAVFRTPPGKYCLTGTVSLVIDDEPVSFSFVSGWDSSTDWATEQGSGSDGTVYRLPWRRVSADVDEGDLTGTLRGMKVTEKDRIERKGKDGFVVICTERIEGDKKLPDMTFVYHRAVAETAKKKAKE